MEEKIAVIKEMPAAAWHGQLWDDVTHALQQSLRDEVKDKELWNRTVIEVNIARQRALDEKASAAEVQRFKNLEIRKKEREERERAKEEVAQQILASNAKLDQGADEKELARRRGVLGKVRPKPPPGLLGLNKWGTKIERK